MRLCEASKRRRREPYLGPLGLGHTELRKRGPYVAWRDAVYPDAAGGPFTCEALRQRYDPCFGGVVGGLGLGVVRDDARHGGDVDDRARASFEHGLPDLAAAPEHAGEVHGDDGQPLLVGDLFGGDVMDYSGVVYEHVYTPVLVEHHLYHVPHGGGVRYVGVDEGAFQLLGDVRACLVVDLGDDHLGSGTAESAGDRQPEALASAGDDRDPVTQGEAVIFHLIPPFRSSK